ncbi:MAG: phage/plasmid primase, P4 family [Verrucomicrobiae bacterium]|nr:phage/plasmid primase, P4 family [Verrucomicrobiae bacterium]
MTPERVEELAQWRDYAPEFVEWLRREELVGIYAGKHFAFPVTDADTGKVIGCHYRLSEDGSWRYAPKGLKTTPLVIGDLAQAKAVYAFESQWDLLATLDACAHHENPLPEDIALVATRGASNDGNLSKRIGAEAKIYAFPQNDDPGQEWLEKLAKHNKCEIRRVITPEGRKDLNEWTRTAQTREAMQEAIAKAIKQAEPIATKSEDTKALYNELTIEHGPRWEKHGEAIHDLNAYWFAGLYAKENHILFDPADEKFHQYNAKTGAWDYVTEDVLRQLILLRLLRMSREENKPSLERQRKIRTADEIIKALRGVVEKRDAFNREKNIIHVANGMLCLSKYGVELKPFAPEYYSRNPLPISYNSKAPEPKRFLEELLRSAMSEDDISLLQRWGGMVLTGYNSAQRFLILDGTPGGGKTTLTQVLKAVVGERNAYQMRTEQLDGRFEMYRFIRKTLLFASDVPGDFLTQTAAHHIKSLVGGDPITPEAKGSNETFYMYGTFNLIINCNARLRVRLDDDQEAWRRRLLIIRYENPPPAKKILDFDKVLMQEEGEGILKWFAQGYLRFLKEIDETGNFQLSEAQKQRVDDLLAESNSLEIFVETRLRRNADGDITTDEIIRAYSTFCEEAGWDAIPATRVEKLLPDLIYRHYNRGKSNHVERGGTRKRGWQYLSLKTPEELQDDEPQE